jgi:hypothetical protein
MLATDGGLLFTGLLNGEFIALDQDTGQTLWKFKTGSAINSPPITYTHQGRQFVTVLSGVGVPNGRCKVHGGKSTGPRTPEGLERSRRANWKHGHYSREAKAERSGVRAAILALRYLRCWVNRLGRLLINRPVRALSGKSDIEPTSPNDRV